jgi:hypothetical protein
VTVRFRIDSVSVLTTNGVSAYRFPADLTVLAGKTGVGKTTLFELIKFGLGGDGALAEVVRNHVHQISIELQVGDERYRLNRSTAPSKNKVVQATDLITSEQLPEQFVSNSKQPSVNTLLMTALGLPTDARAAPRSANSNKPGALITFGDVFTFLYIPQSEINRQIAHSEENYREPKRRALFELLTGLTNDAILGLQGELNALNAQISEASKEHQVVLTFLRDSQTTTREDAEQEFADAQRTQREATAEQTRLRRAVDPITDRETAVLRDLLNQAERAVADARALVVDLTREQGEYAGERRRVRADLDRLQRMRDASERLADIEFVVCPRCMQSVTGRAIPAGSCRVCLQPDPLTSQPDAELDHYEATQLSEQITEIDKHLTALDHQLQVANRAVGEREALVSSLTAQIDTRTAERVTPRLQAVSDAAERAAAARTRQELLEPILRQWDRADDLGSLTERLKEQKSRKILELERAREALDQRRKIILAAFNNEFQANVGAIGIPGVESAHIDPKNYLPILNDSRYSRFSGTGGGIITAVQVAYWSALLAVALRDRETRYPAFLLIDTPRLALQSSETLSRALYRRLVTLADSRPGDLQLIIADNELPEGYRGSYDQINFSYDHPTISTITHPGPTAVKTLVDDAQPEIPDLDRADINE